MMTKSAIPTQELSELKKLVKKQEKALSSLQQKLSTSQQSNRELRQVLKKK
jgi:hypothetical protein